MRQTLRFSIRTLLAWTTAVAVVSMVIGKWTQPDAARGFLFSCGYGGAMTGAGVLWFLLTPPSRWRESPRLAGWLLVTSLLFWGGLMIVRSDAPFSIQLPALFCWLSSFFTGGCAAVMAIGDLARHRPRR